MTRLRRSSSRAAATLQSSGRPERHRRRAAVWQMCRGLNFSATGNKITFYPRRRSHRLILASSVSPRCNPRVKRAADRFEEQPGEPHQLRPAPLRSARGFRPAGRSVHFIVAFEVTFAPVAVVDAVGAYLLMYVFIGLPGCTRGRFRLSSARSVSYRDFPTAGAQLPACPLNWIYPHQRQTDH